MQSACKLQISPHLDIARDQSAYARHRRFWNRMQKTWYCPIQGSIPSLFHELFKFRIHSDANPKEEVAVEKHWSSRHVHVTLHTFARAHCQVWGHDVSDFSIHSSIVKCCWMRDMNWLSGDFISYRFGMRPFDFAGLADAYPKALEGSVAVLTPYKAQLGLLRSVVGSTLSKRSLKHIEFATVDGFQVYHIPVQMHHRIPVHLLHQLKGQIITLGSLQIRSNATCLCRKDRAKFWSYLQEEKFETVCQSCGITTCYQNRSIRHIQMGQHATHYSKTCMPPCQLGPDTLNMTGRNLGVSLCKKRKIRSQPLRLYEDQS